TGQVLRVFAGQRLERQEGEHLARLLAPCALFGAHARAGDPVVPETLARLPCRDHHAVLEHGHPAERARDLEGAHEPRPEDPVRRQAADRRAEEGNRTRGRPMHAGDRVEQRRLAGAVRTDQSGDRVRPQRERNAIDGAQPAELLDQVADLEHRPLRYFDLPRSASICSTPIMPVVVTLPSFSVQTTIGAEMSPCASNCSGPEAPTYRIVLPSASSAAAFFSSSLPAWIFSPCGSVTLRIASRIAVDSLLRACCIASPTST